jgi:hypothetical protein
MADHDVAAPASVHHDTVDVAEALSARIENVDVLDFSHLHGAGLDARPGQAGGGIAISPTPRRVRALRRSSSLKPRR